MIQINEYRLSQDKKYLIIDVLIEELFYYKDVTLDSIILNNQSAFNSTGIATEKKSTGDWVYIITECEGSKHYRQYIDLESVGFPYSKISNTLFFMLVNSTLNHSEDTPCGMKDNAILGVTYARYPIYLQGMNLLNELGGCEPSSNLIDYILTNKAFDLSLQTGNYQKAIEYWNEFHDIKGKTVSSKCGCHGRFK